MTCLPRVLAFLRNPVAGWTAAADELWAAAAWPPDGAQRLADAEAEREVSEPTEGPCLGDHAGCDGSFEQCCGCDGTGHLTAAGHRLQVEDGYDDDPIADCHVPNPDEVTGPARDEEALNQTYQTGPRPRIATARPRRSDSDRLDQLIELVEDVRNLLQHNDNRGRGKDVGQRAERSSGAVSFHCPTSPSQTPTGHPLLPSK